MRTIGFSTGSLALGNFKKGLHMLYDTGIEAVELSALRKHELNPLVKSLNNMDVSRFRYVSVHAPSKYEQSEEKEIVNLLIHFVNRGWPIIVHPDSVYSWDLWRQFGRFLFIENMDKRKPVARYAIELEKIFNQVPEAMLCFDIGHARQHDTSMEVATKIIRRFRSRLGEIHISEVGPQCQHLKISSRAIHDFQKISSIIPKNIPVILETPVGRDEMLHEIMAANCSLLSYHKSIIYKLISKILKNNIIKNNKYDYIKKIYSIFKGVI